MGGNGHVIADGLIAVDCWRASCQARYFFLTHCHSDHVGRQLHRWRRAPLYTGALNARLLNGMYGVPHRCVSVLPLDETVLIGGDSDDEDRRQQFEVTALDARHCAGSLMLLFQGCFGTILYTGDFRYCSDTMLQHRALRSVIDKSEKSDGVGGGVDQLYLDNTYCSPQCDFPPRAELLPRIVDYVGQWDRSAPVYIGMRRLGKEEVLVAIGETLGEKIYVNAERMAVLHEVVTAESMTVFTSEPSEARIHVVPFSAMHHYSGVADDRLCLQLTALHVGWPGEAPFRRGEVQLFAYSDHSSFDELCRFVGAVRPRQVLPIVTGWGGSWQAKRSMTSRADMSVFRTFLAPSATVPRDASPVPLSPVRSPTRRSARIASILSSSPPRSAKRHKKQVETEECSLRVKDDQSCVAATVTDLVDSMPAQSNSLSDEEQWLTPDEDSRAMCGLSATGVAVNGDQTAHCHRWRFATDDDSTAAECSSITLCVPVKLFMLNDYSEEITPGHEVSFTEHFDSQVSGSNVLDGETGERLEDTSVETERNIDSVSDNQKDEMTELAACAAEENDGEVVTPDGALPSNSAGEDLAPCADAKADQGAATMARDTIPEAVVGGVVLQVPASLVLGGSKCRSTPNTVASWRVVDGGGEEDPLSLVLENWPVTDGKTEKWRCLPRYEHMITSAEQLDQWIQRHGMVRSSCGSCELR